MKASPRDHAAFLKSLDPKFRAVLIFGKDDGLIRENRDRISGQIISTGGDPFGMTTLNPAQVRDDPALIADEMGAVSMMGGRRLVRLDDASDKELEAIQNALTVETGDSLLLVTAGDLGPRSKLRKFFETESAVLALACYADSLQDLTALISEMFRSYNVKAEPDVLDYLKGHLGNDRIVTRSELEKIIFFLGAKKGDIGPPKRLSLEDAQTLTSDSSAMTLADIVNGAFSGKSNRLAGFLDKARTEGTGAIEILRTLQNHLMRLDLVRGLVDEGKPLSEAMARLRPPVFFKERDSFAAQVRKWPEPRLQAALNYTVEAEAECKKTGVPDFSIAAKACMDICAEAQKNQ